ncbi:phytase [Crepidotus variabilis]|uniref:Phytase n=1 Tax=Crepidotus variabilis TaxID=179855 RepID=A0A9P6JTZ3_9AGAR|nr:phytase [Crepidotus variabilis]
MPARNDIEAATSREDVNDTLPSEEQALLPSHHHPQDDFAESHKARSPTFAKSCYQRSFTAAHVTAAFVLGALACVVGQYAICGAACFGGSTTSGASIVHEAAKVAVAPPWVGSTVVHNFPPTKPTNAFPSMFPTNVGYPGATPTGAEPAVIATAPVYPTHPGQCSHQLIPPASLEGESSDVKHDHGKAKKPFNLLKSWGNLSPWYSVGQGTFGLDTSPERPDKCVVTGLHFLHRHGARYPTAWADYGGPANFGTKLHKAPETWNASGPLEFLNSWTYKLGEELLTPFGRQQLYDLGISARMKYGFLLQNFTEKNTIPVFRTESQDRMLASAMNFAIGFFGYPFDKQYQQLITIEAKSFNNTLAPYSTCSNANQGEKASRGLWYIQRWADIYLKNAKERLQKYFHGLELSTEDVYTMQQMCPYETVALGYSKFCELFTEEEWEGFNYGLDLQFWYGSAFGSPVARIQGIGYIQELVSRLTHTRITEHRTSTNSTITDSPVYFPLNESLYVDATHEVVVLNIITALNLTNFAASGPLPHTHIPPNRSFRVSELAPFATNVQFQLLECSDIPTGPQIRIIINDGVVPLTGIKGCPQQKDGMCSVDAFVKAQKETIEDADWDWECHGDWEVPAGNEWETISGTPPRKKSG